MKNDSGYEVEVGRMPKNSQAEIVARLQRFHGVDCFDIRVFAGGAGGQPVPTKQGICASVERLPDLRKLVDALLAASASGAAGDERTPAPNQEDEA